MPTTDQAAAWVQAHAFELIVVLFSGMITWQLLSGVAWGGKGQRSVARQDEPGPYWFRMAFQALVLAVVVVIGKEGWRKTRRSGPASVAAESTASVVPDSPHVVQRRAAYDLHRAGKYLEAITLYDSVLAGRNPDTEVLFFRGVAQVRLGRNDLGLVDFLRVVALDDTNFTALQAADRIMSRQARWDELITMWTTFIQKNPASARAYFERGGTHYRKGNQAAARADISRACDMQLADACNQMARLGW